MEVVCCCPARGLCQDDRSRPSPRTAQQPAGRRGMRLSVATLRAKSIRDEGCGKLAQSDGIRDGHAAQPSAPVPDRAVGNLPVEDLRHATMKAGIATARPGRRGARVAGVALGCSGLMQACARRAWCGVGVRAANDEPCASFKAAISGRWLSRFGPARPGTGHPVRAWTGWNVAPPTGRGSHWLRGVGDQPALSHLTEPLRPRRDGMRPAQSGAQKLPEAPSLLI